MSHLWADKFGSSGSYAVCGFFVISGYVITMVLHERYFQLQDGLSKFWINRFLRLYPTFIIAGAFGYFVSYIAPNESNALAVGLARPEHEFGQALIANAGFNPAYWPLFYIPNITMLGIQAPLFWITPITFAPTASSTSIELYYYILLSLGVAQSATSSKRFLLVAIGLLATLPVLYLMQAVGILKYGTVAPGISVNAFSLFYKTFLGWSFFFAIGSFCYFIPKLQLSRPIQLTILTACLVFPFVYTNNVYVMIALRVIYGLIVGLTLVSFSDDRGPWFVRLMGDVSYPLFLIHWQVAALVAWLTGLSKNDGQMLLLALSLSIAISVAIVLGVERPIEALRRRFRV